MLTPLFEEGERKDDLVVKAEAHAKELEEQYTKTLHEQEALVAELRKAVDPKLKDQIAELGEAVDQKDREIARLRKDIDRFREETRQAKQKEAEANHAAQDSERARERAALQAADLNAQVQLAARTAAHKQQELFNAENSITTITKNATCWAWNVFTSAPGYVYDAMRF